MIPRKAAFHSFGLKRRKRSPTGRRPPSIMHRTGQLAAEDRPINAYISSRPAHQKERPPRVGRCAEPDAFSRKQQQAFSAPPTDLHAPMSGARWQVTVRPAFQSPNPRETTSNRARRLHVFLAKTCPSSTFCGRSHEDDRARGARGRPRGVPVPRLAPRARRRRGRAGDTRRRRRQARADPRGRRRRGARERGVRRRWRRPVRGRVGRAGPPVAAHRAPVDRALVLLRTGAVSVIFSVTWIFLAICSPVRRLNSDEARD
jgi:hypothetical protein